MKCIKCKRDFPAIYQYCYHCGKKNNQIIKGMVNCPVCKRRLVAQGLKNHIWGMAKQERQRIELRMGY